MWVIKSYPSARRSGSPRTIYALNAEVNLIPGGSAILVDTTLCRSYPAKSRNELGANAETAMPNSEEVMLTKEQQWRLAELVTGEKYAIQGEPGHEEIFLAIPHDDEWEPDIWEPSLDKDSEDWQQAQALRVIVAAMSLPSMMNVHRYSNGYAIEYWSGMEGRETPVCPDILQASTMALLHGAES